MSRVLIACLGAGLTGDLAAGPAVHALLTGTTLPQGCRLALVPPGILRLLGYLDGEEAIVAVGEVEMGTRPGELHVLEWNEVPFGSDGRARNGHALRVTMEAARLRSAPSAPRRAFLVGVEGRGPLGGAGGMHLEVASALAGAARVVMELAHGLATSDEAEITRARRATPMPREPLAAAT